MNKTRPKGELQEALAQHFAPTALEGLVITRRDFPHWMRPDLQRTLAALFASLPGTRFFGARLRNDALALRFADLLEAGPKAIALGPAEYHEVHTGDTTPVRCLVRGLWLAESEGARFALLLNVHEGYGAVRVRLEIAVLPGEQPAAFAARLAERIRAETERSETWRGKTLVLEESDDDFDIAPAGLRVHQFAPVRREDIVLQAPTLALVERNTVGFARHAAALTRLGLSAKKGVLLYGPPGTGKTMIVRWLAGALEGYTKLTVKAEQYALLTDYISVARVLQPALVVLEDVDLIAGHRDGPYAQRGSMLNTLLNAMDGLAPDAQLLFVLTTNRPEVLEPALAERPGRIDQAIEIGLPGEAERKILVIRYAGSLTVSDALAGATARRSQGASPAFIKELMRRAAHAMLERSGSRALEAHDIDRALEDMLGGGGHVTPRILGAAATMGFTAALR